MVDLSKAFDCIVHDLLPARQSKNKNKYGFDYNSLKLINGFPSGRKFRPKIGSSYSLYLPLLLAVPQGSILGSVWDLFSSDCGSNINYTDDTTH